MRRLHERLGDPRHAERLPDRAFGRLPATYAPQQLSTLYRDIEQRLASLARRAWTRPARSRGKALIGATPATASRMDVSKIEYNVSAI